VTVVDFGSPVETLGFLAPKDYCINLPSTYLVKFIPVTYLMKVIPVTYLMKVIPVTYLMKVIPETHRAH
jgi:hypothetical protein